MARRTKEEAAATRKTIIEVALALFSEQGYAATTLNEIADRAGVTRGAIYWHFENKADLFGQMVDTYSGQFDQITMQAIQEGGSFLEICERVMVRPLQHYAENPNLRAFIELVNFRMPKIEELEAWRAQRIEMGAQSLETFAGFFRMGIESGELRSELDPMAATHAFIALQNGLTYLLSTIGESFPIESSAQAAANIFVRGIQNKTSK